MVEAEGARGRIEPWGVKHAGSRVPSVYMVVVLVVVLELLELLLMLLELWEARRNACMQKARQTA